MIVRCDRVTRYDYVDSQMVYSLIVNDDGMYIIHTGHTRSLRRMRIKFLQEDVPYNEQRLSLEPLDKLAAEEHSTFLSFAHIYSVVARTDIEGAEMYMRTREGDFRFIFDRAHRDYVRDLLSSLSDHQQ